MKKIIISCFIVLIMAFSLNAFADELYDISIELQIGQSNANVNGENIKIDKNENVVPFIENDRTLVPIRFIADSLGLNVEWIEDSEEIILTDSDTKIELIIGEETALVNGNGYYLDCAPLIKEDRTFVPLRFIGEALQCEVYWEEDTQKVFVGREKEFETDINDEEVQKLFSDVLNQNEFASYYAGYCDNNLWDNSRNMFSGTMRELFSLLTFKQFEEKQYSKEEAENVILDFLSEGDISKSLSTLGIDNLKTDLERGANFGNDSEMEMLTAVYDGKVFDDISIDLFGEPLPRHENIAYSIGYHAFHLFNRVNLFYPYSEMNYYYVYYNEASNEYLFTKPVGSRMNFDNEDKKLNSETKLIKATKHNGKISLYIQRYCEYEEYAGGIYTYEGVYKNTYKKGEDGYFWINSYGMEKTEE